MQITDLLADTGGLQSIARELGISEAQVAAGARALGPMVMGGFQKQARAQPSGLDGLGGLLGSLGGGGLLDDLLSPQPTNVDRGNAVLGEIFGSRDVSRAVAQNAAAKSGLDPALLKRMLPMLAMLVAGYMSKRQGGATAPGAGGGLGDLLGGLLGGGGRAQSGSGGLGGLLDADGDGNPLDDILRRIGQ
jgi:hypothetical protein